MRLSSVPVELLLATVPGWTGGSGAGCWQKAKNPQKQLAPSRAATRMFWLMLAWHRKFPCIATNGILGATMALRAGFVGYIKKGLHPPNRPFQPVIRLIA